MKLEDQVCSLELAKRLKELGVTSPSIFIYDGPTTKLTEQTAPYYYADGYNAYSVAELGEMMAGKGMGVTGCDTLTGKQWWVSGGEWIVEKQKYDSLTTAETEADARAKMLIHLIENKIITLTN